MQSSCFLRDDFAVKKVKAIISHGRSSKQNHFMTEAKTTHNKSRKAFDRVSYLRDKQNMKFRKARTALGLVSEFPFSSIAGG